MAQSLHKTRRKTRKIVRTLLLGFTTVAGGALGWGAFEYHQLATASHFQNLAVVGGAESTTKQTDMTPTVELPGTFNVVLLGSDARPGQKISHSDTIIIVHVDLNHHVYNMISLPRDSRTYFPGYGYTKLTTIQFMNENKYGVTEGIQKTVQTLSQVTGIPINFYAETSFTGLEDMVNAVGGVEINLPFTIRLTHPIHKSMKGEVFKKGSYFLNGAQTLEVVRERDTVPGGDYGRQQIQERALIGIAKEVMKPKNLPHLPKLAQAVPKFLISTNMSAEDLVSLGLNVRNDFHPDTQIHYFQIPSVNDYAYDSVLQAKNDELLLDDKKLKAIIQKYFLSPNDEWQASQANNTAGSSNDSASKKSVNNQTAGQGNLETTPGAEILNAPSRPQDFGPLGGPEEQ